MFSKNVQHSYSSVSGPQVAVVRSGRWQECNPLLHPGLSTRQFSKQEINIFSQCTHHTTPHHVTSHHITSHHGMEYCCSMSAPALPCHFHCKQEPARETQHTNHYYTFPSTGRTQLCNANSAQSIRCLPI